MNLHVALTKSHELLDDPHKMAGKLLADHRAIVDTIKEMIVSGHAYLLLADVDEWEIEANALNDVWCELFELAGD